MNCRGLVQGQNGGMKRLGKWLLLALLAAGLLVAAALFALQRWIGTDDFRARVQTQIGAALGVGVKLGRIVVDVWPVPGLALVDVDIQTRPPMAIERVEVRPVLQSLLAGRVELATLLVRRADLPQAGIDDLLAARKKKQSPAAAAGSEPGAQDGSLDLIPRRVVLDAVTWRSAGGDANTVDAESRLSPDGLPDTLTLKVLDGKFQGARIQLSRKALVWDVKISHARGTIQGQVELLNPPATGADLAVKGRLETRDLELSELTHKPAGAPVGPLSGKLEASTSFSTRAASAGGLVDGLQTQSRFTVRGAVLHGVDLARAVKTVGLSRGGETRLDTLAGQVNSKGKTAQLNNLVASSGVLSASGNVALAPSRVLSGRLNVSLGATAIGEVVGVPLVVGGTLDAPEVTLTRAAMLGAAIGTVVMPGLGTGAGASLGGKLGDKLKGLFGK